MGTATIKPDGSVVYEWDTDAGGPSTTNHDHVDEGTDSPDTGTYIETNTPGNVDTFDLEASPAAVDTVTQLTVNLHGYIDDASVAAQIQVDVKLSGGTHVTGSPFYVDGSGLPGNFSAYHTTPETVSVTLTGLTLSKADVDGLQVSTTLLDS